MVEVEAARDAADTAEEEVHSRHRCIGDVHLMRQEPDFKAEAAEHAELLVVGLATIFAGPQTQTVNWTR